MILVTGSTGFIGGHLIRHLMRQKQKIRVLIRKKSQYENMGKSTRIEPFYGDLTDVSSLKGIMQNVDVVFHLASIINANREHKEIYWNTNVFGTQHLLELIRRERRQVKKFIFCSSVGAMGPLASIPADESTPCFPHNVYEQSKCEAEKIVEDYREKEGIPVSIVRPSWVYGPADMRTLKLFKAVMNGRLIIFGNGKTLIHPVYVGDVVQGLVLCAFENISEGQTYIIAGERSLEVSELAAHIAEYGHRRIPRFHFPLSLAKLLAIPFEMVYTPFSKRPPVSRRSFEFFSKDQSFSIVKAKKELGYTPKTDLAKGLNITIRWYRENNYL
jgi:nucleoside-diphosphate-sugar epimerase